MRSKTVNIVLPKIYEKMKITYKSKNVDDYHPFGKVIHVSFILDQKIYWWDNKKYCKQRVGKSFKFIIKEHISKVLSVAVFIIEPQW